MATFRVNFRQTEVQSYCDLQNLCLCVITTHFERYFTAYEMPNSNVPRRHLEFLVRCYTKELFERLKTNSRLRPEHIDVLINPYLKELDIVSLKEDLLPWVIKRLKTTGSSIISLKALCDDPGQNFYEPLMSSLPNVERIDFRGYWSSELCKIIGRNCILLKALKLGYPTLHNSLKLLCNEGIAFVFSHCPCLENVQYSDTVGALYELHKNDLATLRKENSGFKEGKKYTIRSLSSQRINYYYPLCDALEICYMTCPYVSDIQIDNLEDDGSLEIISRLTALEKVVLCRISGVTSDCFNQFLRLRGSQLISLEMPLHSCLSVSTLIHSCAKMKSVKFKGSATFAGDNDESSSKELLSNLNTLEFYKCDFRAKGPASVLRAILSAAKNVKKLTIAMSLGLTNEFVGGLDIYNVNELDLRYSDIRMHSLRGLLLNGNLKKLNIEQCRNISREDYFSLSRCLPDNWRNGVSMNWSVPKRRHNSIA